MITQLLVCFQIRSNVEILSNGDVNEIELDASDKPLVDFSEPTSNSVSPKQMKMPAFLMQNGLEDQNLTDVPLIAFEENSNIVGKPLPGENWEMEISVLLMSILG